jgi:serine/threonine protein kinase
MNTDFQIGEKIGNRWEVEKILHGGMGFVYVVMDRQTGERLAAKTYRGNGFVETTELAPRFKKEALAWIRLGAHPNVVQAKFVETFRHKPFLFLEYVPGGNLRTRLPLTDLNSVQRLAIQFCDGMIHAALSGVTAHRDIKPENCLLNGQSLKISDFGLVKCFDDLAEAPDLPFVRFSSDLEGPTSPRHEAGTVDYCPRLGSMSMIITRTGVAAGTPRYMAPEQFEDIKRVDVKADIYSFGVMLFQMITGRLPFSAQSLSEYRRLHQQVRAPKVCMEEPACRTWLADHDDYEVAGMDLRHDKRRLMSDIVDRCLAKDPTRRFKDFRAVREALVGTEPWDPYETYMPTPPPLARARQLTEFELLSLGLSYLQLGREVHALAAFDRLILRYPRNRMGHLEKGKLLMTMPHRHDEGRVFLERAESIGGRPYTQLDADAALPKLLDDLLDQLFKKFEHAHRAFVFFREGKSRRLVVRARRTRLPQDEDADQDFPFDQDSIDLIHRSLYGLVSTGGEVMCAPLCDASRKGFGVIWVDTQHKRGMFTEEDLDLLDGVVEGVFPPWLIPFIRG